MSLVKAHFSGELIECDGRFVSGGGYSGLPHVAQRPAPPIMIGGSRKRVLSLAAREADIVSMSHVAWTPGVAERAPVEDVTYHNRWGQELGFAVNGPLYP
jgi:alkanesulfonate monooxygenase SsuD/methylene tetrahydromethanopterin reductase-like flavin-dependent oxidoreductase (luciferase family)